MPAIGQFHPQIVHFVVASLFIGLPIYLLGFLSRPRYFRPMASILLVIGTTAAWVAVKSGTDAHGSAERIPGVRAAVQTHEDLGLDTRTLFTVVLIGELLAIGAAWRMGQLGGGEPRPTTSPLRHAPLALRVLVAGGWAAGAAVLFETAEHGGALVYEYAGGVGMRRDDPQDVERLLIAGLYNEAQLDRSAGRSQDAARLIDEMAIRAPDDIEVQLLRVESLVIDRHDGRGALEALARVAITPDDARLEYTRGLRAFDAYELLQMSDSARAVLDAIPERYQQSAGVRQRRERIGG